MIVVIGSKHDRVANELVAAWPKARLLSADDLTSPGWVWSNDCAARRWVVAGDSVADADVTGVFLRRSTVYPEELLRIHPEDRAYMSAEAHAHLIAVLSSTRARVVNPVVDAGYGEEALRVEHWRPLAERAGLPLAPIRLSSAARLERPARHQRLEVVGAHAIGKATERCRECAIGLVRKLGLWWATCVFDHRQRLVGLTSSAAPSRAATAALGPFLAGGAPCS